MSIFIFLVPSEVELSDEVKEQVEIQIKYEGYIEKIFTASRAYEENGE